MTVLEERLSSTEYIYVIGRDGKPQMPTTRRRHVLKLLDTGKARVIDYVPFTIQLKYENTPVIQPVVLAEDPGRTNIGVAAVTEKGDLLFSAVVETRNKEIKKLMSDRRGFRQASRRGERKARQRLAKKHGTMVKAGMIMRKLPQYAADSFVTCKFIRNTEARFCNRKRPEGWLTPTVRHLVQTHINIVNRVRKFLPVSGIALEVNRFSFVQLENPEATGLDFQNGPLKGFNDVRDAVSTQQGNHCLMCKKEIEHFHHIVPRHRGGSDTIQNLAGLCKKCHEKAHTQDKFKERISKKKEGLIKKYGALSALNQAVPYICMELIKMYGAENISFCTGRDTSLIRTSLGYEKTKEKENQIHEVDAYCIGIADLQTVDGPKADFSSTYRIKQFRRQDRSRINHQTERTYYYNGVAVAKNRKPRFEQKTDSFQDWFQKMIGEVGYEEADRIRGTLTVKKSKRYYNSADRLMPGTEFYSNGQRYIMSGQHSGGARLRAVGCGTKEFALKRSVIRKQNVGLVFL